MSDTASHNALCRLEGEAIDIIKQQLSNQQSKRIHILYWLLRKMF